MKKQLFLVAACLLIPLSIQAAEYPVVIESTDHAILSSPRDGKLNGKMAEVGEQVKKGKVLASLNTRELNLELNLSRTEYSYFQKMEREFASLLQAGLKTNEDVGQKRMEKNKALAQINITKEKIAQSSIKAPYNAYVVKRLLQPHEWAAAGAPVLEIVNNEKLFVIANLPAELLTKVHVGDSHEFFIEAIDLKFNANLTTVIPNIDVKSNTFEVRWLVSNPDNILFHGMRGKVIM